MALVMKNDPRLMVQLAATSVIVTAVVAKLNAYKMDMIYEVKQDIEFVESLNQAYLSCSESDAEYAESFTDVSAEVDKLALELNGENDK